MKVAIMQPYFFPYLGYFQLIHAVDTFVFYDDVNFIKGGWIHRNRILAGGEALYLSARLSGASSFKKINQVELDPHPEWRQKLLRKIDHSYGRAPEFKNCFPVISEIILGATPLVADLARQSVTAVLEYLNLERNVISTSSGFGNEELKGQERVIAICKRLNASVYCNPPGGRELYDAEAFRQRGMGLCFVNPKPTQYQQLDLPFVPNLSIIDVLMFNPRDRVRAMLAEYDCS